ncbi:hypothetical protein [Flagellimonas pacifica]|uniref:Lipoprotein n=1 Tax=Flagellimonas pacifica TaxID=1247520 RepID=A0A285MES1_9FLAO|nr:hypothetical protein [Allomuricauda parva]SNY94957.1 hypothetical protein SAMN06265377_0619 [Allomuricauda parva]
MKKIILSTISIALFFVGCSKDDDKGEKCSTCTVSASGISLTSKYCDNGDGTMTVTTGEETNTVSMEGLTFNQFIAALKESGVSCK